MTISQHCPAKVQTTGSSAEIPGVYVSLCDKSVVCEGTVNKSDGRG